MMNRPDPDALLKKVQDEEERARRGRLKVFFGMAPGVGKTYAMLWEARERAAAGVDVVAGVIETHGRADTQALLDGIEVLPPRSQEHGGVLLHEFDLDAALARQPDVLLVDELAHTNAPGSRHLKRWQDIEELLDAGLDVYTTVNVQHLESLNDVIAQITSVVVRETVPDRVLELADEIELIDLTPAELRSRLKDGKVYVPQSVERALENFFREGNLTALRELALRRTADRVDAQMQTYRRDHSVPGTWPAAERLLVCVGPNPVSSRLVRAACRMAAGLHAEWIAAWVETPATLSNEAQEQLQETLQLARSMGGETISLAGPDVAEALLELARERNVSKIVVGKPVKPRWRERLFGSVVDDLVRRSGDIDVYVITGDDASRGDKSGAKNPLLSRGTLRARSGFLSYVGSTAIVVLATALAWTVHRHLSPPNLTMIYLAGVVLAATRLGRGPSVLASVFSVLALNFFFVPPYYTLAVDNAEYLVTFAVLLGTGLLVSNLMTLAREAAHAARRREMRTAALYALTRDLAATRNYGDLVQVALRHIEELMGQAAVLRLPVQDAEGDSLPLHSRPDSSCAWAREGREEGVARWAYDHASPAGAGTGTLPAARGLYLPLRGANHVEGVLGVEVKGEGEPTRRLDPEHFHLLEALASQVALALERARLSEEAQQSHVQFETERMRNSLLSAVSHDLRTPLASIVGASSTLLEEGEHLPQATHEELLRSISGESERLHRLVSNLLEMTHLQSGAVRVHKEWQPLEEVVGAAMTRFEAQFGARKVTTNIPAELPLVPIDATLMEQVFINLIENALKYSPPSGSLHIAALKGEDVVMVEVSDRGPGVPAGHESEIFNPFFRVSQANGERMDTQARREGGAGLGLAICKAIVEAHGGMIWVENRPRGGAVFRFTIPLEGEPPSLEAMQAS